MKRATHETSAPRLKCKGHKANGAPCGASPIKGGTVCRVHGGSAPQVREAARFRILELVNPALAALSRALKTKGKPDATTIAAAKDILDRAGFRPVQTHIVRTPKDMTADELREWASELGADSGDDPG